LIAKVIFELKKYINQAFLVSFFFNVLNYYFFFYFGYFIFLSDHISANSLRIPFINKSLVDEEPKLEFLTQQFTSKASDLLVKLFFFKVSRQWPQETNKLLSANKMLRNNRSSIFILPLKLN